MLSNVSTLKPTPTWVSPRDPYEHFHYLFFLVKELLIWSCNEFAQAKLAHVPILPRGFSDQVKYRSNICVVCGNWSKSMKNVKLFEQQPTKMYYEPDLSGNFWTSDSLVSSRGHSWSFPSKNLSKGLSLHRFKITLDNLASRYHLVSCDPLVTTFATNQPFDGSCDPNHSSDDPCNVHALPRNDSHNGGLLGTDEIPNLSSPMDCLPT